MILQLSNTIDWEDIAVHFLKTKFLKAVFAFAVVTAMACTSSFGLYVANVTRSSVNLRTSASGSVVSSLPKGTKLVVIDNSSSWYRVAVNGKTGYVFGKYVCGTSDGDFALGNAVITGEGSINVRAQANTTSAVVATAAKNTKVAVVGVYNDFYKVKFGKVTGYVYYPYVYINGRATTPISRGTSATAEALRNQVINYAANFLGTPYVYGGSTPSGFDCSGFTSYVYNNTVRSIPRTSNSQYSGLSHVGSMSDLKPADLVFFGSNGSISHVGIYVGNGKFIHSPHTGSSVKYDTLWSGNYNSRYIGASRVIFD